MVTARSGSISEDPATDLSFPVSPVETNRRRSFGEARIDYLRFPDISVIARTERPRRAGWNAGQTSLPFKRDINGDLCLPGRNAILGV